MKAIWDFLSILVTATIVICVYSGCAYFLHEELEIGRAGALWGGGVLTVCVLYPLSVAVEALADRLWS